MSRSAIVTGGAGFIGSHLVDRLADDGWSVLVIDDLSRGRVGRIEGARKLGDVKFHQVEIQSPDIRPVFERFAPDVVFHLAAQSGVRPSVDDPLHDANVNILGTLNVLEAGRRSGVRRIVFASSGGGIYGGRARLPVRETYTKRPDSPYGISKKAAGDYFSFYHQHAGIEHVQLALANVYGPRQDPHGEAGVVAIFSRAMLDGRQPTVYGDGTQTRDYVYVDDVVDAFVRGATLGSGLLMNIGTGRETSVQQLFELLAPLTEYLGRPRYAAAMAGDVARSVVDPSRARKHLGWEAWTSLDDGLANTVNWFRANPSPE